MGVQRLTRIYSCGVLDASICARPRISNPRPCTSKAGTAAGSNWHHPTKNPTMRWNFWLVDLLRRYSNRPDLCYDLAQAVRRVQEPGIKSSQSVPSRSRDARHMRISERLTGAQIQALIARYRTGCTAKDLAVEYGIGTTSVKRILRDNHARHKDTQYDHKDSCYS